MRRKGFTLIELLVVIAIIALLLSILLPGLRAAKLQAQLTIDMTNLSGLGKAWFAYIQDNKDELVGGNAPGNPSGNAGTWIKAPYYTWVDYPISKTNATQYASDFDYTEEIRGIENGLLFSYVGKASNYHCPADKRYLKAPTVQPGYTTVNGGYRSYSIVGGARGGAWDNNLKRYAATGSFQYVAVTKFAQIKNPGDKIIFVEENDGRGLNAGAWDQDMRLVNQSVSAWQWVDLPAIWHFDRSSFAFADGHAEKYKWVDAALIRDAGEGRHYLDVDDLRPDDFAFILRSFPYLGLP